MKRIPFLKTILFLACVAVWDTSEPFVATLSGPASLPLLPWAAAMTWMLLLVLAALLFLPLGRIMTRCGLGSWEEAGWGVAGLLFVFLRLATFNRLTHFYMSREHVIQLAIVLMASCLVIGWWIWRVGGFRKRRSEPKAFLWLVSSLFLADAWGTSLLRGVPRVSPETSAGLWASLLYILALLGFLTYLSRVGRDRGRFTRLFLVWGIVLAIPWLWMSWSTKEKDVRRGPGPSPVLLITVDSLRRDAVSCYGEERTETPHMDSLAEEGLLYMNALAPAPWTTPSLATLLTGLSPSVHLAVHAGARMPRSLPTVAEAMRDAGYKTAALVANPILGPATGLAQGFEEYIHFSHSPIGLSLGGKMLKTCFPERFRTDTLTEDVTHAARRWLKRNRKSPFFLWIHYFDPHLPYAPPVSELRGQLPPLGMGYAFSMAQWRASEGAGNPLDLDQREWVRQLYLAEVRHVDRCLGMVLEEMRALGLFHDALFLLTSDHGEEFWEHGGFEHGHSLHWELLRLPLIVRWPGARHRGRIHALVSLEGIAPTLLSWCGIGEGPSVASRLPLQEEIREMDAESVAVISTGLVKGPDQISVQWDHWKYMEGLDGSRARLFDLSQDPEETQSLVGQRSEVERTARKLLDLHQVRSERIQFILGITEAESQALGAQEIQNLKNLGYME